MRGKEFGLLFLIGAAGAMVGDAGNVDSGATLYFDKAGPIIWQSAWWFPLLVGLGTVSVGVARLRLGDLRPGFDPRVFFGSIAAVIGLYAVTSLGGDDRIVTVALCWSIAVVITCFVGDRAGIICGVLAAIFGPLVEIGIVKLDLSEYNAVNDTLFGVALWLPPLYFAFGVVVAVLTEQIVARRG